MIENVADFLSQQTFSSLKGKVNDRLLKSIESMGFKTMTEIQAKCIGPLLEVFVKIINLFFLGKGRTWSC